MDNELNSRLLQAVDSNNSELVKQLIRQGANVNFQYDHGVTCLMHACQHDLLQMAKLLVSLGADVNIQDSLGNTALILLCLVNPDNVFNDIVPFVKFLLVSGADINIRDNTGHTVLEIVKNTFPDNHPIKKNKIINILEKWPVIMGILGLQQSGAYNSMDLSNIEDLFQYMGISEGGKKRKSKKRNKKSKKRKRKSSKRK
jgi:hypothetical protein